ncbi:MAG TPA: hypothetical protein VGA69_03570 [Nitriliruptorales bacterium]
MTRALLLAVTLTAATLTLTSLPSVAVAQVPLPDLPVPDAPAPADEVTGPLSPGNPTPGHPTPAARAATAGEGLVGTFQLTPGSCTADGADGTWFRMLNEGVGVSNNDSPCDDNTYNPLEPGSDGGLVTGGHQPHPDPAFDGNGNARAARLTLPASFFGADFSTATNPVDPQTGTEVAAPSIVHDGQGGLSGDLRAFAAAWNGQHFNQGSPKPDGSTPGSTTPVSGTYDPDTGAFTLQWTSHIQGGPFNGFTGVWHLTGLFESSEPAPATTAPEADGEVDGEAGAQEPGGGTVPQVATGADRDVAGRELADTGPALPPLLGLVLLSAGRLVRGRRP